MTDDRDLDDVPAPAPASAGEPEEPGESADPLTAPGSTPGDEVHDAMIDEATGDQSAP
jgi:hypothetical protein